VIACSESSRQFADPAYTLQQSFTAGSGTGIAPHLTLTEKKRREWNKDAGDMSASCGLVLVHGLHLGF